MTANASSDDVWEVFEEVVGFGVTFSYLGLPVSLAQPVNASSFKVLTRPANLPIEVVVSKVSYLTFEVSPRRTNKLST